MSIIIAKNIEGVILILSDSKVSINSADESVSGDSRLRISPVEGILKTLILYGGICISYAGDVVGAVRIINMFKDYGKFQSIDDMCMFLKDRINSENADVEFILCLASGSSERYLYKITSNKIEKGMSLWIGDRNAFSKFQEIYSSELETAPYELKAFQIAFRKLIDDQSITSIGDFIVETVYSNYPCFFYCERLDSVRGS
jgi:hypothetical protein